MFKMKYKPGPDPRAPGKERVVKMICPYCEGRLEWEYNCPTKCPECQVSLPFYERLINSTTAPGFRVKFHLEKSV